MTALIRLVTHGISQATGRKFELRTRRPIGGGCINSTEMLDGGDRRFFLKLNEPSRLHMFEAEAAGLAEIARSGAVRVPAPVCWGVDDQHSYLVLEYLALGPAGANAAEKFGAALARMHQVYGREFGWHRDNTIGTTPQINTPSSDWAEFWGGRRLRPQFELAARRGHTGKLQADAERLLMQLPALFADHKPKPSLLHGDLWAGNFAADEHAEPVIFDPAVYFGDRETDLAMTELFGGFPTRFYDTYREALPLASGYTERKQLYNLYHVLNHLNLFGGGYLEQAQRMLASLLRALA